MKLRRRTILLAIPLALVLAWSGSRVLRSSSHDADQVRESSSRNRSANGQSLAESLARGRRSAKIPWSATPDPDDGSVTIAGSVIDATSGAPVGNVEVVFRSDLGEETTTANADGTYSIDVPAGTYRTFVRDDAVLSVGRSDRIRLPGAPNADTINAPDEALMPMVVARTDASGIDLAVVRGGIVKGRVIDRDGRPVARAVLRANSDRDHYRPALGSDVFETADDGTYELKLPEGNYTFAASHARYAGVTTGHAVHVSPGGVVELDVTLARGCIVTGKVVLANGKPANDGALERQWGSTNLQYAPTGRIESDGSFKWTSVEEERVVLRAWPWKAPPSPERAFECKDGARFDNVVFTLPDVQPDIAGVLVDAAGAPVPFAYVDLSPLTPGGIGQQERTDAEGKWAVYQMPAGRYQVRASSAGRGVATAEVGSPESDVKLQLGGTGRITGTTQLLARGSLEVRIERCVVNGEGVEVAGERRIVDVVGGRFTIEGVPACHVELAFTWRDQQVFAEADVTANGTADLEVQIGPPHPKTVTGIVRDPDGRPAAHVTVTSTHGKRVASVVTDGSGRFSLASFSGASLTAIGPDRQYADASVGMANVATEQIDLELSLSQDHYDIDHDQPDDDS